MEASEPRAVQAGITLQAAIAPTATLEGDPAGLHSLLTNLLDNALRYTPAPGTVRLDLVHESNVLVLQVTDSGPGIPREERHRVFDRFYRIPGTHAQGSGLGLAIVRRVVEWHGGEITIGSGPGGVGARFTLRLPVRRISPALQGLPNRLKRDREKTVDAASRARTPRVKALRAGLIVQAGALSSS